MIYNKKKMGALFLYLNLFSSENQIEIFDDFNNENKKIRFNVRNINSLL